MIRLIVCADCGKEKPHKARGLCSSCYTRWRRKEHPYSEYYETHAEERRAYSRRYHTEHRDERIAYARKYQREHKEELTAYDRKRYQQNRGAKMDYQHQWRKNNRERHRAYSRRYYEEHREQCQGANLAWQKENPEAKAAIQARYNARKAGLPYTLTHQEAHEILGAGRCFYCEREFAPEDLTLEHFVPVSKGGGTTKANIIAACKSCNSGKRDKLPGEFLEQMVFPTCQEALEWGVQEIPAVVIKGGRR